MTAEHGNATNSVLYCWEQVLRTNRLFRISHAFAPPRHASRLLALYALFGAVEEICSECSDDTVAMRKLDWWRQECQPAQRRRSQHPIVRALMDSGAEQGMSGEKLAQLFDNATFRLDAAAPPDIAGLRRLCEAIGRPRFELELAVCGGTGRISPAGLGAAASSGLLQLLREGARRGSHRAHWWAPLNLLARHGINRARLADDIGSARALFLDLFDQCSDWPGPIASPGKATLGAAGADAHRHLHVMSQLQGRRLVHLKESRLQAMLAAPDRPRLSDAYFAWRAARTVSRP